jgi:hypothetical protein
LCFKLLSRSRPEGLTCPQTLRRRHEQGKKIRVKRKAIEKGKEIRIGEPSSLA